jgi:hypothetical protein
MTRFLFGDLLWKAIAKCVQRSHRTKAAIAYVTRSLPLSFRADDVLVVDATDHAIASGQTSASVLATLLAKGVQLHSHRGLHAKLVLLDSTLFASSANLSGSSIERLLEAGIETDNPNAVSAANGLIERLLETSTPIDQRFVGRIQKIKVIRHFTGEKSKAKAPPKLYREPVTWLLGIHDVRETKNPDELRRIETGTAKAAKQVRNSKSSLCWIRYGRSERVSREARRGDSVVVIHRTKPKGEPERVYHHAPLLLLQEEASCVRLFYEELPNAKRRSLSWSQFRKLAKLVGLPEKISKNAIQKLTDKVSSDINDHWEQARVK